MWFPDDPLMAVLDEAKALHRDGELAKAMLKYREVLEGDVTNTEAMRMLALALVEAKRPDAGARLLENALAYQPNWALCRANYALALLKLEKYESALEEAQMVLLDQPEMVEALRVAGHAALALKRFDEAVKHLKLYEEINPEDVAAQMRLAAAYLELEKPDAARQVLENIGYEDPDYVPAKLMLGQLVKDEAPEAAADLFLACLDLEPANPQVVSAMASMAKLKFFWRDYDRMLEGVTAVLENYLQDQGKNPFSLSQLLLFDLPIDLIRSVFRKHSAALWEERRPYREALAHEWSERGPQERLRIGYFTSNIRNHPKSHLLRTVLREHDRERFEVFLYSAGPDDGVRFREEIADSVEHFVDIHPSLVKDAAERIVADRIHIYVDLDLHGSNGTPRLACMRPAPLTVAAVGGPESWGSGDAIDYTLMDSVVVPDDEIEAFAERVVQLPTCYIPFNTKAAEEARQFETTRDAQGLPKDAIVLASFCGAFKLSPAALDDWCAILARSPRAVLWVLIEDEVAQAHFRAECERRGVAATRIFFAERIDDAVEHIGRVRLADLYLDNLFYGAHTTAMDALLAEVPVLTVAGEAVRDRVAASMLSHAGAAFESLVCKDRAAYIERGVALCAEPEALVAFRQQIREDLLQGPLLDNQAWIRGVEAAFEHMWDRHATGRPPKSFSLS